MTGCGSFSAISSSRHNHVAQASPSPYRIFGVPDRPRIRGSAGHFLGVYPSDKINLVSIGLLGLSLLIQYTLWLEYRCHVKMGTPQIGDPESPFSWENGDPGPYFHNILGTRRVPIFTGNWGPSHENGDPQCNTLLDIDWTAWL